MLFKLKDGLKKNNVVFNPLPPEKLWGKIERNYSSNILTGMSELIATVISLMKSNEYDIEQLRLIGKKMPGPYGNNALVSIVEPIYGAYAKTLISNGEIDFNDMINKATHMIREGKFTNPYKYVIVDEYQDISRSRFNLLKALRESSDYKLFCVGDDWQSIYRFTGSDLDYILNFSKYWGATELSKIETTYRFTNSLINISGQFIMQNPAQIKKNIKGAPSKYGFALGEIKAYKDNMAVYFMLNKLRELPSCSSVYFIGRYNFDSKFLSECPDLECNYNLQTQTVNVVFRQRKDLRMEFLTAHKSKGLQADYVFIINNKNRGMGFPSKIQDDPLVDSLLEGNETFPFAEERRLFYVALTRARIKVYLVVVENNKSVFATEMEKRYEGDMKKGAFTCPKCGGQLVRKNGKYGEFYGCANYGVTGCNFTRNIAKKNY